MNNEIIKVRLENPIDGYEIDAEFRTPKIGEHVAMGGNVGRVQVDCNGPRYLVLTPKLKHYDWSKTSGDCLVYLATGVLFRHGDSDHVKRIGIYNCWQAITDRNECPVDNAAVNVEYRSVVGGHIVVDLNHLDEPTQYRVIGLKPGYKY